MPASVPWWKRTTVYQIYPRSFADGNGDGVGDLSGILGKLDYLQALGVETLWLSPFFQSPQADFGYDISDHLAIAPEYGTLADVRALIHAVHARGMKIVFDMVLNHTSDEHPWFLDAQKGRGAAKRDWYIWRDGRKPAGKAPPNNWRSMLGGSGWHYHDASDQWYFASFLGFQPDLNYRNPAVKAAMLGVVRHWFAEGVDGMRLDIFNALFKDAAFSDNPFSWRPVPTESNPHGYFQRHVHTIDHPDTLAFARELRQVVDEFSDPPRFLVGEVFGDATTLRSYCGEAADGLHLVFLFETLTAPLHGRAVRKLIRDFEAAFPEPFSPTWVFGNHDRPRLSVRVRGQAAKAKLLAALQLTVRGVPFLYYGEEIGMENHAVPLHEGLDPVAKRFQLVPQPLVAWFRRRGILLNRDECRSPMQWTGAGNGGFTPPGVTPWLPLHRNSHTVNVAAQDADPDSLLACYRLLLALRRAEPALQAGALRWLDELALPPDVVAFSRELAEDPPRNVAVFLNFAAAPVTLDLGSLAGRVMVSTRTGARLPVAPRYALQGHEALVVVAA